MLTKEQETVLKKIESGKNIFLTGKAGTGKSYVLNYYLIMSKGIKNVIVTAPTGIAAINVGGSTIHRAFNAPTDTNSLCLKNIKVGEDNRLVEADVLVIDEISMCRIDLFDYVMEYINQLNKIRNRKDKPDIQLILVGDFFQLPPVIKMKKQKNIHEVDDFDILCEYYGYDIGQGYAFQSESWKDYNIQTVYLHEIHRQKDINFINILNDVRIGNAQSVHYLNQWVTKIENADAIHLCPTNRMVEKINLDKVRKLQGKEVCYCAKISGDFKESEAPTSSILRLKIGAKIMMLINDTSGGNYVNGSLGYVVELKEYYIVVQLHNGNLVEVHSYTWNAVTYEKVFDEQSQSYSLKQVAIGSYKQLPVKIAYAVTIHKSQGQTFDAVNLHPQCFTIGQLYVALSRCVSLDTLSLMAPIQERYLLTSNTVLKFYEIGLKQNE